MPGLAAASSLRENDAVVFSYQFDYNHKDELLNAIRVLPSFQGLKLHFVQLDREPYGMMKIRDLIETCKWIVPVESRYSGDYHPMVYLLDWCIGQPDLRKRLKRVYIDRYEPLKIIDENSTPSRHHHDDW